MALPALPAAITVDAAVAALLPASTGTVCHLRIIVPLGLGLILTPVSLLVLHKRRLIDSLSPNHSPLNPQQNQQNPNPEA